MSEEPLLGERVVAAALLGGRADSIQRIRGLGRNSRIFLVRSGAGKFALKQYPLGDIRDRLGTEAAALALMERGGIEAVPRVIAHDAQRGYVMMNWIEGRPVEPAGRDDINSAACFLRAVHGLRVLHDAAMQPLAAEACLSGQEILCQITSRIERLRTIVPSSPELNGFLALEMGPALQTVANWARHGYGRSQMSFSDPLSPAKRSLCPSDFGFHNALRTANGGLVFIDFEYFGWDDPVKLVCDFLLHPAMAVSGTLKDAFARAAADIYGGDQSFCSRFNFLYPLFGLRWCLILLNEFLPERWAARVHAGEQLDWDSVRIRQLKRARTLLTATISSFEACPYLSGMREN
jgi:phosphotransferase family enzyme